MAHPHAMTPKDHRDKARAVVSRTGNEAMHGKMRYARGGHVHEDEAEDADMIREGVGEHEENMHAGKPKTKLKFKQGGSVEGEKAHHHLGRRARGGPTNGKRGTHVNVIVAPQGGGGMRPAGPMPAAQPMAPPRPPAPPPQAMPPRPPMGAPPPGGGMPMAGGAGRPPGMMKRGGGVKDNDAGDAAEFERKKAQAGATGGRKVVEAGVPWENILHSKRGGKVPHRDMGGMTGTGMPSATAGMPGQQGAPQMTPQQQQAAQQMAAQRAAQARMNPAGGAPGMPTQKRGGRTERKHGGSVEMEAGAGGGEGRIEKMREYGSGRGFKPKEHEGEFLKRRMVS